MTQRRMYSVVGHTAKWLVRLTRAMGATPVRLSRVMTEALTHQIRCFAELVDVQAPNPTDMRPMIGDLQTMFRELERAGNEFASLRGNHSNLGLARIAAIFRNLKDLCGRWRDQFPPQAPRPQPRS
jgi:hypothetical protein